MLKDNVRIEEHGMITSAIKKTSVYCSISLNPYMVFLKLGITDKKSKKESNSIVSLLLMSAATTNRSFICEHCL